jgi:site-specific DNA recombinase
MNAPLKKVCAIYTRKSTDEGLDQSFNSLDAQREACEAYIKSQAHEGWHLLEDRFDDGGISGGTMERPGLKALMAMIERGLVDTIVVYKVDRLTRSLADFARIVDVLDASGASFVSVTQQFNTTNSMGRLTLNVLLSFAQFEREVTAERIRDKFRASKQKGMWMGGHPSLGYDVKDRRLVVNEEEAETVRMIFRLYATEKSAMRALNELEESGVRSKARITKAGNHFGGNVFSRGALYRLLSNKTYLGKVDYKGTVYEGEHEAIVPQELWDGVAKVLAKNRCDRIAHNTPSRSFLKGRIFTDDGRAFSPTHANKKGKRYRYYQTKKNKTAKAIRLPAPQIEEHVVTQIRTFFQDPKRVIGELAAFNIKPDAGRVLLETTALAARLASPFEQEAQDLAREIVAKVTVGLEEVQLALCPRVLVQLIARKELAADEPLSSILLTNPSTIRRTSRGVKLITPPCGAPQTEEGDTALKAIRQAHLWLGLLTSGKAAGFAEIARQEGTDTRFVARTIRLAFLAPEIVEQALVGDGTAILEIEKIRRGPDLPLRWREHAKILQT